PQPSGHGGRTALPHPLPAGCDTGLEHPGEEDPGEEVLLGFRAVRPRPAGARRTGRIRAVVVSGVLAVPGSAVPCPAAVGRLRVPRPGAHVAAPRPPGTPRGLPVRRFSARATPGALVRVRSA